jgi:hypothetical protein
MSLEPRTEPAPTVVFWEDGFYVQRSLFSDKLSSQSSASMKFLRLGFFCVFCLASGSSLKAIILLGGPSSANETNPGTGLPWQNVVAMQDSSSNTLGSGVYLGNQFVLTAAHVSGSQINISGQTFVVDTAFNTGGYVNGIQQVGSADLKLIRLSLNPADTVAGLVTIQLNAGNSDLNRSSVAVGYGRGNGAETVGQSWGWDGTSGVKRWGTNTTTLGVYSIPSAPYTSTAIETVFNEGAGANEFALALADSGSGLFFQQAGIWYLSGIGAYVETFGQSFYANSDPDSSYFIRMATYKSAIDSMVAIPEPGTITLLGLSLGIVIVFFKRKHEHSV